MTTNEGVTPHMEQRLARVEENIKSLEHELAEARKYEREELSDIKREIRALSSQVTALTIEFAKQPRCPAPGKCLELEKLLNDAVPRLSKIENLNAKMIGGIMAGTAATSFVGWLIQHFFTHPSTPLKP